jgi:hypothetical protein
VKDREVYFDFTAKIIGLDRINREEELCFAG